MRRFTESELKFDIMRGLQQIPRSTLRAMLGADEGKRPAMEMAVDIIAARFDGLEIYGPDPLKAPGHP